MNSKLLIAYRSAVIQMINKESSHISWLRLKREESPAHFVAVVDTFIKGSQDMLDHYYQRLKEIDESLLA